MVAVGDGPVVLSEYRPLITIIITPSEPIRLGTFDDLKPIQVSEDVQASVAGSIVALSSPCLRNIWIMKVKVSILR
jgi:hypothetical protein